LTKLPEAPNGGQPPIAGLVQRKQLCGINACALHLRLYVGPNILNEIFALKTPQLCNSAAGYKQANATFNIDQAAVLK
jgi:hypothetical protein